jgi:hypothetical protein
LRAVVRFVGGAAIGGAGAIGGIAVLSDYPAQATSIAALATLYMALLNTYRAHADKKERSDRRDPSD